MQTSKIKYDNPRYPKLLRQIHSPPRSLYVQGNLVEMPLVAIVGSRRPTDYGRQVTYRLAGELASAGLGIVSGLALGIDAIAHQAALAAGGYTVAVLGSGLEAVHPPRNRSLARQIVAAGGALMSEYEADAPAYRSNFPARNRIIAGMSLGVVVTEAAKKSGSAITAKFAREEGREVMAVPGNITSLMSDGTNQLIQAGATPILEARDALNALGLNSPVLPPKPVTAANQDEAAILSLIDGGVSASRDLIARSGLDASRFAQTMSLMEITGKIRGLGGDVWVRR